MEIENLGSIVESKYWKEYLSTIMHIWKVRYKNYINHKRGKWLMWLVVILSLPFKTLMIPINYMLNLTMGYSLYKRLGKTLIFIRYRKNTEAIRDTIQKDLAPLWKCYERHNKATKYVIHAERIVQELYQRELYSEMIPILERLYKISCIEPYLTKSLTNQILLAECYIKCEKPELAQQILKEAKKSIEEYNRERHYSNVAYNSECIIKAAQALKEYYSSHEEDSSFVDELCALISEKS